MVLNLQPQVMQPNRAPQPYPGFCHKTRAYSNAVEDSTLPSPENGKDIPSEKNLDLVRQFKGSPEIVERDGDRLGRSEMEDSMVEDSAADMLDTALNLGVSYSFARAVSTTTKTSVCIWCPDCLTLLA
ncbi:hypothetical protein CRYUN_Cryun04dG0068600 [Craigia yunnanensis]